MRTQSVSARYDVVPYVVPFLCFAVFIYAGNLLGIPKGLNYLLQTIATGSLLYIFRNQYRDEIQVKADLFSVAAGVLVFLVWVLSENLYPQIGASAFNPFELGEGYAPYFHMAVRLAGAAVVVPLMEELFWRSFATRFLIDTNFKSIRLGEFSWFSFIAVSVAFGFEHHRWLPGIFAGLVYTGLLYRSKNLFSPILSHAVTNFLLGVYVIKTGLWTMW